MAAESCEKAGEKASWKRKGKRQRVVEAGTRCRGVHEVLVFFFFFFEFLFKWLLKSYFRLQRG